MCSLLHLSGTSGATNVSSLLPDCTSTSYGGTVVGISRERVGEGVEVLLLAVMGITNLLCFVIGAKVGQKVTKGEPVELPSINPMKAYREHEARKESQREQDRMNTILRNIEGYDGTSTGQMDVPRG